MRLTKACVLTIGFMYVALSSQITQAQMFFEKHVSNEVVILENPSAKVMSNIKVTTDIPDDIKNIKWESDVEVTEVLDVAHDKKDKEIAYGSIVRITGKVFLAVYGFVDVSPSGSVQTGDRRIEKVGQPTTKLDISAIKKDLYYAGKLWQPTSENSFIICTSDGILGVNVKVKESPWKNKCLREDEKDKEAVAETTAAEAEVAVKEKSATAKPTETVTKPATEKPAEVVAPTVQKVTQEKDYLAVHLLLTFPQMPYVFDSNSDVTLNFAEGRRMAYSGILTYKEGLPAMVEKNKDGSVTIGFSAGPDGTLQSGTGPLLGPISGQETVNMANPTGPMQIATSGQTILVPCGKSVRLIVENKKWFAAGFVPLALKCRTLTPSHIDKQGRLHIAVLFEGITDDKYTSISFLGSTLPFTKPIPAQYVDTLTEKGKVLYDGAGGKLIFYETKGKKVWLGLPVFYGTPDSVKAIKEFIKHYNQEAGDKEKWLVILEGAATISSERVYPEVKLLGDFANENGIKMADPVLSVASNSIITKYAQEVGKNRLEVMGDFLGIIVENRGGEILSDGEYANFAKEWGVPVISLKARTQQLNSRPRNKIDLLKKYTNLLEGLGEISNRESKVLLNKILTENSSADRIVISLSESQLPILIGTLFTDKSGEVDLARFLIDKGANVNVIDTAGRAPLDVAAESGNRYVFKGMIDNVSIVQTGGGVRLELDNVTSPRIDTPYIVEVRLKENTNDTFEVSMDLAESWQLIAGMEIDGFSPLVFRRYSVNPRAKGLNVQIRCEKLGQNRYRVVSYTRESEGHSK